MAVDPALARRTITRALEAFLRRTHVRKVHFAQASVAPPALAYVTSFPRLSVPLAGRHPMEIAQDARSVRIAPGRGDVVFVGRNSWNKPDWSVAVKVLTFLFGKKQIGISLVAHDGRRDEPTAALKTAVNPRESLAESVLSALTALAAAPRAERTAPLGGRSPAPDRSTAALDRRITSRGRPTTARGPRTTPLDRLLAEALLHACLQLLAAPAAPQLRKAMRTYETLCLYVQENFSSPISRDSAARNFGLTPNHVSRLFRREGQMRFSDYVTRVRIDRAKFMLKEYSSPLKEIAAHCGYQDVAYFCRVFRRITKVTPTEYRLKGL